MRRLKTLWKLLKFWNRQSRFYEISFKTHLMKLKQRTRNLKTFKMLKSKRNSYWIRLWWTSLRKRTQSLRPKNLLRLSQIIWQRFMKTYSNFEMKLKAQSPQQVFFNKFPLKWCHKCRNWNRRTKNLSKL